MTQHRPAVSFWGSVNIFYYQTLHPRPGLWHLFCSHVGRFFLNFLRSFRILVDRRPLTPGDVFAVFADRTATRLRLATVEDDGLVVLGQITRGIRFFSGSFASYRPSIDPGTSQS